MSTNMEFKNNYVEQLDETDCGAATLAMILKYYKSDVSLALLRKYAQTDKDGTTGLGMIKAAEHFGLATEAIKYDTEAIKYDTEQLEQLESKLKYPFIAHVNKGEGLLHYVVVISCDNNTVHIADPDSKIKIAKLTLTEFSTMWSGIAFFMWPSSHYKKQSLGTSSLLNTAKILLTQKKLIVGIIVFMTLSTFITIGGTFYLEKIVDEYIPKHEVNQLSVLGLVLIAAYVFHGLFSYIEGLWSAILGKNLSNTVLSDYLNHLLKLPIAFFDTRQSGELTSRFSDASSIISALSATAITTLLNVGTIAIISFVLLFISVRLFLIALVIVPIYAAIIAFFAPRFNRWNNDRMEKNATVSSQIIEDLHGIETIKTLSIEEKMYRSFTKNFSNLLNADFTYNKLDVIQEALKDLAGLIINLSVLYLGALLVLSDQISLGELVAFTALFSYFLNPIQEIINLQNEIQTASVANKRLSEIMSEPTEIIGQSQPELTATDDNSDAIQFKNVEFEYKYGQPVLHDINLTVKQNQSTAIIGLSGSGKTTLAKLLIDFYKPTAGQILINGHDIDHYNKHTLRTYIGYLSQTPHIFTGSIFENIALGHKGASLADVRWAAQIAQIDDDIMAMPERYETKLTEESGLSGGQLQRLAIARTILKRTPIMILDESTSNLDLETEKKILINIRKLDGVTVIFIAHRLQVTTQADNIIVMKNGFIIENGSRQTLEQQRGTYYQLLADFQSFD